MKSLWRAMATTPASSRSRRPPISGMMSNRPDGASAGRGGRPALSVVVMGYRNELTIKAALDSLASQTVAEPPEVLVVTSGGDGSAALVRREHPNVEVIESGRRLLPGGARNAGVTASSGEYVAFLAADCVAAPEWAAARLTAHRRGYAAVAGPVTNAGPDKPWAWASLYLNYRERLSSQIAREVIWPHPAAHSLSLSRALLDELGPFDEGLLVGEDTLAARSIKERGVPIWFEPQAEIAHCGPKSTRAFLKDQYLRGSRFVRVNRVAPPGDGTWWHITRAEARRFASSVAATTKAAYLHRPSDRWKAAVAIPWIVSGALALRIGRIAAFRRAIR